MAPYYVEYLPDNSNTVTLRAPYNPSIGFDRIAGTGRVFEGIGESTIVPGANVKAAINFELGTIKSQVTGFEAGFLVDFYTKKIDLVPTSKNYSVYPTLFLTLFYGNRK